MVSEEKIVELAVKAGLVNYVDLETPRHYFVHGHAEVEDVIEFARYLEKLIRYGSEP